jgi:hypothetical protein
MGGELGGWVVLWFGRIDQIDGGRWRVGIFCHVWCICITCGRRRKGDLGICIGASDCVE